MISPREVDESLLEHPAVVQATAFAVPHNTLGKLEDIIFCAQKDRYEQAPVYRDGLLLPFDGFSRG